MIRMGVIPHICTWRMSHDFCPVCHSDIIVLEDAVEPMSECVGSLVNVDSYRLIYRGNISLVIPGLEEVSRLVAKDVFRFYPVFILHFRNWGKF